MNDEKIVLEPCPTCELQKFILIGDYNKNNPPLYHFECGVCGTKTVSATNIKCAGDLWNERARR